MLICHLESETRATVQVATHFTTRLHFILFHFIRTRPHLYTNILSPSFGQQRIYGIWSV